MDINALLSELVVVADRLDHMDLSDIGADVDAAVFIMSADSALPRNKSLLSVIKENLAAVEATEDSQTEALAVSAAEEISALMEEVLTSQDSKVIVAVLTSISQSLRSVLHPNTVVAQETVESGSELLMAAEDKLRQHPKLKGIGHRIGMIRAKLEHG